MKQHCCKPRRVQAIRGGPLNGLEWLEVRDREAPAGFRQRLLRLHFVNAAPTLAASNVMVEGGERVRSIAVVKVAEVPLEPKTMEVEVDRAGDASAYVLRLVRSRDDRRPPAGIDPALASIEFRFKVECPDPFDCRNACACATEAERTPEIDYLARDFAGFRRLALDRMALLLPEWGEAQRRHPADLGVALAELFAWVGDRLSYRQDAIATEAYLGTARRRVSVRRHARLVDYDMHEGCVARTFVHLEVDADVVPAAPDAPPALSAGTALSTRLPGDSPVRIDDPEILAHAEVAFETMHDLRELRVAHNAISFHTWSDESCCLPRGATRATLKGTLDGLRPGDWLLIEEVVGPETLDIADADPLHRCVVRLTGVQTRDPDGVLIDPLTGEPITEVSWSEEDALDFPVCISVTGPSLGGVQPGNDGSAGAVEVSMARGNVVLADHGRTIDAGPATRLGAVPPPALSRRVARGSSRCAGTEPVPVPVRFRPMIPEAPLTFSTPLDYGRVESAREALRTDAARALPAIRLDSVSADGRERLRWLPRRDLLDSQASDTHVVVEVDDEGRALLRFGDDESGRRPDTGTAFSARYRVGNGAAGNIGRESLVHVATIESAIVRVHQPLPAVGGTDPEHVEEVRLRAPVAFRRQARAVTPEDYAERAEECPGVQRATAMFRWTGSWYTVFVTIDRVGGAPMNDAFEAQVRAHLERYRLAGHDLEIDGPRFVPLELHLAVCVDVRHDRSAVHAALLERLGRGTTSTGARGHFHPDRLTFGQAVHLSPVIAAAQSVTGVTSVQVTRFRPMVAPPSVPAVLDRINVGALEIARLDNDPNAREHGILVLDVRGGR